MSEIANWLIWSNEHDVWWNPDSRGYTTMRDKAGRYGYSEAKQICDDANKSADANTLYEIMVPSPELETLILALPDLLASCKELCERLEHNELVNRPSNPCNHYDQPAYDRAKAAIAKVEGAAK